MSLSDYQVGSVIKAYLRNMATKAAGPGKTGDPEMTEDSVIMSHEGLRTMLFGRIGEQMTGKLKKQEALAVANCTREP